jgi:hypothetical protein
MLIPTFIGKKILNPYTNNPATTCLTGAIAYPVEAKLSARRQFLRSSAMLFDVG